MQKLSEHQINKQCHAKGCQQHPLFVTAFQPVHKAGDQQQGRRIKAGEMYQPAKRGDQSHHHIHLPVGRRTQRNLFFRQFLPVEERINRQGSRRNSQSQPQQERPEPRPRPLLRHIHGKTGRGAHHTAAHGQPCNTHHKIAPFHGNHRITLLSEEAVAISKYRCGFC